MLLSISFFFQAEDGIRDLVRSRGLGDVYKRQTHDPVPFTIYYPGIEPDNVKVYDEFSVKKGAFGTCLLYTSDAADERSSVDLGGRRIIKKKNSTRHLRCTDIHIQQNT